MRFQLSMTVWTLKWTAVAALVAILRYDKYVSGRAESTGTRTQGISGYLMGELAMKTHCYEHRVKTKLRCLGHHLGRSSRHRRRLLLGLDALNLSSYRLHHRHRR